jgi:hypothetical protein
LFFPVALPEKIRALSRKSEISGSKTTATRRPIARRFFAWSRSPRRCKRDGAMPHRK